MEYKEKINYELVLADLKAQRLAIDEAIVGLKRYIEAKSGLKFLAVNNKLQHAVPLNQKPFLNKSIIDAALNYLEDAQTKKTTREIADALEMGGIQHNSSNFLNTVFSILYRRQRSHRDIVKNGKFWLLKKE